jgi:hypothetical protein
VRLRLVVPAALAALALPLCALPAAAAPTIEVDPVALDRGPDPSVPFLSGDRIVDGDRRIPLPEPNAGLLGRAGDGFVVWSSEGARKPKLWRVAADGSATLLLRSHEAYAAVVAAEGDVVVVPTTRVDAKETRLTAHDTSDGSVVRQTTVRGFASVLDVADGRAVVGSTTPSRTLRWDLGAGRRERLSRHAGYEADLAANRLAVFDGDPFRGGCSVVSSLSFPGTPLSRSCTERVDDFSPGGRRMATVDLLTDGIGPNRVTVRTTAGKRVVTYDAPYFFGLIAWERPRALLLETFTSSRSALVRCVREDCERASKLGPAPELRPSVPVRPPAALVPWTARRAVRS